MAYFALIKANITVIPLNTTLSVNELEDSYRFCNADLILIDEIDLNKKFSTDINYTSINQVRNFNIKMEGIYINTYDKKYDIILRTSGSTSNPKYVCFSEEKVMSNVIANIKALNITNNDIIYILLPMAFSYCMHAMVLSHLYVGAKLVIKTTTVLSQKQFYKIINEKHITSLGTVPQQLKQYMINDRYHENHLKKIFIGGDFAFKSFRKKVLSFFPDSDIYYTYGMTEAGPRISNCKCNLNNIDNESVGKALEGVIIELRDEYEEKINDINIEGEVVIKSSSIMCGYLKNNNMTNKVIRDGYLFTGDIGYFNEKKIWY